MHELTVGERGLASGGTARVLVATARDVQPLRAWARSSVRTAEYAHHFAVLANARVRATALPPVHLASPDAVRLELHARGEGELLSLRSALRRAIELGPGAPATLDRLIEGARGRGLVGSAVAGPNGVDDRAGEPTYHAWLGPAGRLREVARHLPDRLMVNGHFFAITPGEQPSPHGALGDPVGAFARGGVLRTPPVSPRATLLHDGTRWTVATLGLEDVETALPHEARGGAPIARFARSPEHPGRVRTDAAPGAVDVAVVDRTVVGVHDGGHAAIPPTGIVLRYAGPLASDVRAALLRAEPVTHRLPAWPTLRTAVQGGPMLLRDGQIVCDDARLAAERFVRRDTPGSPVPSVFPADADVTRAARLGVGVRRDGTLVVIAVEGRSSRDGALPTAAHGATLLDLAELLARAGAVHAVNLDGGGSVQAYVGRAVLVGGADRRGTAHTRFDRLVPTGLAFA